MKNKVALFNGESTFDSTLLIPADWMPFFEEKVTKFGGIRELFQFVVNLKHPMYNHGIRTTTGRTVYAPEGWDLKRVNFRPRNEDWERFRIIAQSQRISMAFLFVLVLMFWDKFNTDVLGVPVTLTKIALLTSQTVGHLFTIIHLCRHRI